MTHSGSAFLIAAMWCASAMAQTSADTIGHVHKTEGLATIERKGASLPAAVGTPLQRSDVIRTGKPGAVGIVLTDDTTVSLGSGSELALADYAFEPKEGKVALTLRMIKGTFSYITGQIVKLAPETAQIQTPDATIAVRGTKLLIQIGG